MVTQLMKKIFFAVLFVLYFSVNVNSSEQYFKIKVIDSQTERGIPLVELKTLNSIRYFTDSNGIIAFYEPGFMGQDIYFRINGQGYEISKDMFGATGAKLRVISGDSAIIKLNRKIIAERFYRITGAGIYRDSYILGLTTPLEHPLLNGKVLGQDSNLSLIYKDKIFWIWGDTFEPSYLFGNYSVSAATSNLPEKGGLDPNAGVNLKYFIDSTGFSKKMISLAGPGFVWFDWIMTYDDNGREKLIAKYARVDRIFENHERGIAVFNDELEIFEKYKEIPEWEKDYHSTHHPLPVMIDDQAYYYLTSEFNFGRTKPTLPFISNPLEYEYMTCLEQGTQFEKKNPQLDRDSNGKLVWGWKRNTDAIDIVRQKSLIDSGYIKHHESWIQLRDIASGEKLVVSRGSIYWNEYRKKWILILGKGIGEVWYAEGDTPTGPWLFARKIAFHDKNFYNVVHHPFFDREEGKIIYFEGTYTSTFLQNEDVTPRYEYNQIMYRLRLDDERLFLPVPVYTLNSKKQMRDYQISENIKKTQEWERIDEVSFFAYSPGRRLPNMIPIFKNENTGGIKLQLNPTGDPLFYALPAKSLDFEEFLGRWDFNVTDEVFSKINFSLKIINDHGRLSAEIEDKGFSVDTISVSNGKLKLIIKQFDESYHLTGTAKDGILQGLWKSSAQMTNGTWKAECSDHLLQPFHSEILAPLYEYTNRKSGENFYSTDGGLESEKFLRNKNPLCRVWKNPSSVLVLDFKAQPLKNNRF